ncbi:hypothetical protein PSHT_01814 [Puccinia striiformis]|uniref:Uncharacterized protein n=1 Tax=Puccinia striiformis TaxID=27350 RepID=A0A2S4WJH9_9BASI|nr:hypothetical protein PSHT_01814 [Puccinia striiformis]
MFLELFSSLIVNNRNGSDLSVSKNRMVVIYESNSRRPQLTIHLQRRDSTSSEHLPRPGLYIIIALIFLILASLLLVVILQFQSRRIDERLEAVKSAQQIPRRRGTDRAGRPPPVGPYILPSSSRLPPATSFPSVSCHGSIPDSASFSSGSQSSNDTDATASNPIDNPQLLPNLYSSVNKHSPKKTVQSPASLRSDHTFKFLDEPTSPTSFKSLHTLPP